MQHRSISTFMVYSRANGATFFYADIPTLPLICVSAGMSGTIETDFSIQRYEGNKFGI